MQLTQDQQIKILELLQYIEYLPAIKAKDIIDPTKKYYSPTVAELLGQDLTERQHTEVESYLTRVDKLDQVENDAIDRMAMTSVGRGDIEFNPNETMKLRTARAVCVERIRNILGLPDNYGYIAEYR